MEENGIIESTMLGNEDHGIFSCWLFLKFNGSSQGFGGYALDGWDKPQDKRIGTAYGCEFIKRILETLEIPSWEKLKGTPVRVRRDEEFGPIVSLGHYYKDKWFDPRKDLNFLLPEKKA